MRYLGIDWGEKYIGIAISDKSHKFSFPYAVLENKNQTFLEDKLSEIIKKEEITHIVFGLPYTLSGQEGKSCKKVIEFAQALKKNAKFAGLTFDFFDERLTTKQVEKELHQVTKKRKDKKMIINKATAQKILQDYLDFKAFTQGN